MKLTRLEFKKLRQLLLIGNGISLSDLKGIFKKSDRIEEWLSSVNKPSKTSKNEGAYANQS